MKDKKITNFNEAIHEAACEHCTCMGIHGDYESFRKGTEWMIQNTHMDFQTEILRNSDLTYSLFVVRPDNNMPFSQKELDDAKVLVKLQKKEIARQIIRVKYAKRLSFILFSCVFVMGLIVGLLMDLIF